MLSPASHPLFVVISLYCLRITRSFLVPTLSSSTITRSRIPCRLSFEYDDLLPDPDARPEGTSSQLSSSFPAGLPAGLRGEAVRSALQSGQCIGWELTSDEYLSSGGLLQVQGKGMRDFLTNKLTQDFSQSWGDSTFQEACLLDGKGRVMDRLKVAIVDDETALILTSPGHSSQDLLKRLDPFVFPLDQISLTNLEDTLIFSLASTQWKDIERAMKNEQVAVPSGSALVFPRRADNCAVWDWDGDGTKVLVLPSIGFPPQVCVGFTFCFYGSGANSGYLGQKTWLSLTGESNPDGPVAVGALEYETLRIEAGVPAFSFEIGPDVKTSPLELHWQDTINMEKGCYLGQEGIASIAKNPRGPPRSLYAVVFDDDMNCYEAQSRGDGSDLENLTRLPRVGDALFALGSNEKLNVGTLTSVAESNGTGKRCTMALALVRRADSILKQMKEFEIEIDRNAEGFVDVEDTSGMIQPPPLDPLDGLEVIIGGSYTVGKLQMIPARALRQGRNLFDDRLVVEDYFDEVTTKASKRIIAAESNGEKDMARAKADAEKLAEEAKVASAEAKRKAEKMEMLRKRADAAMERRKKQQNQ